MNSGKNALDIGRTDSFITIFAEAVTALESAIATYEPTQAIVMLVMGNGEVNINLLQHLAISPAECFSQVQRRWAEF